MMKEKTKRIILAVLIIINCIIIFWFSHQTANESSNQSNVVVEIITKIFPTMERQTLSIVVRKIAHFSIYALLGILTVNYAFTYKGRSFYQKALTAFIFCVFYATTDEIHQLFVSGRSGQISDILIDAFGALIGIIISITIAKIYIKHKIKQGEHI